MQIRLTHPFSILAGCLLATILNSAVLAQARLFVSLPATTSAADNGARSDLVASISKKPTTISVDLVRIDVGALASSTVSMSLRSGDAVASATQTIVRGTDDFTWFGDFPGGGNAVLVVKNGEVVGDIKHGLDGYSIVPVGNGVHAIVGVDTRRFPPDHPASLPSIKLNNIDKAPGASAAATTSVQVDVLVAYTTATRIAFGEMTVGGIAAQAQLMVDVANQAYGGTGGGFSGNVKLRLVGTHEITYSETGKTFTAVLNDLIAGTDAQMTSLHVKRDQVGADVVSLLVNTNIAEDYCGLAPVYASEATAYATVRWDCAVSNDSFAHELGHLFGARHDPLDDAATTPFAYGHGFIPSHKRWRTIMAYPQGCGGCPRIRNFSDPYIYYDGSNLGTLETHNNARVFRERATTVAGFRAPVVPTVARKPHDFDGDGKSDLLWRSSSGEVGMWIMNGTTTASRPFLNVITSEWSIVGQQDFNGDRKADILWRNNSSGQTGIWFMDGGTTVSLASFGNIAASWAVVGTGDFDGDGKGDILWRNTSGEIGIWFMNSGSIASLGNLGNVATNWTVVGTTDFDGDGKADILWRNLAGDVGIWFMNGATVASLSGLGNVNSVWTIVGLGDFDGDRKSDILWRSTSDEVGLWMMSGGTVAFTRSLGNVGPYWKVANIGDYDGDGKADILWRSSDHDIGMYLMNGSYIAATAYLGNVGPTWSVQNVASN